MQNPSEISLPLKKPVFLRRNPIFLPRKAPVFLRQPGYLMQKNIQGNAQLKPEIANIRAKNNFPEKIQEFGKLNPLLNDKLITIIECPGPEKQIIIKRAGQMNLTRVVLSQKEIDSIIKIFSEKTKIPVIGGVFRASLENLSISAVISDFVGTRFIINKISPYSIIDSSQKNF